jgi:hypothetical protein
MGIAAYESRRLKLYTDVPAERVQSLPPAIDAAYDAWVDYFGPLPPTREGTEFQITGYLMADKELFRKAGLIPENLPPFQHGRHRGLEFWANEQETDYYRRHLAIHEATHCFMLLMPDTRVPTWYAEGMAELFGTHRIDAAGRYQFRVMPEGPEGFEGLRRIPVIRDEVRDKRWKSLKQIERLPPQAFLANENYAWAWALCKFLDTHPRYTQRFRELGRHMTGTDFAKTWVQLFHSDLPDMRTEWALFSHHLQWGYDIVRAAIKFQTGKPIEPADALRETSVAADRGWQSSGVLLRQGCTYEVTAEGETTLATKPKPWISQPQGISIVYSEGRPIGTLLASIRQSAPAASGVESMLSEFVVGRSYTLSAKTTGTLYFRVNDLWSSLGDNSGRYRVRIRELPTGHPAHPSASQ